MDFLTFASQHEFLAVIFCCVPVCTLFVLGIVGEAWIIALRRPIQDEEE